MDRKDYHRAPVWDEGIVKHSATGFSVVTATLGVPRFALETTQGPNHRAHCSPPDRAVG